MKDLLARLTALARGDTPALVAIDGRCCSGKTTFAAQIAGALPCNVFHMDDFYLPPGRREADWREVPGGNMDLPRLCREVLDPAGAGKTVLYRPYDCKTGEYRDLRPVPPLPLTVVEGSYSLHPDLAGRYRYALFLTCDPSVQLARLKEREGDNLPAFLHTWLPLEERYFTLCRPQDRADETVDTSQG